MTLAESWDFGIGCGALGATCVHELRNGAKALPQPLAEDRSGLYEVQILEVPSQIAEDALTSLVWVPARILRSYGRQCRRWQAGFGKSQRDCLLQLRHLPTHPLRSESGCDPGFSFAYRSHWKDTGNHSNGIHDRFVVCSCPPLPAESLPNRLRRQCCMRVALA